MKKFAANLHENSLKITLLISVFFCEILWQKNHKNKFKNI